jgi:hypothetical protein
MGKGKGGIMKVKHLIKLLKEIDGEYYVALQIYDGLREFWVTDYTIKQHPEITGKEGRYIVLKAKKEVI